MNKTGISYLDFTWNPVTGCTHGCPECWARGVAQTRLAPAITARLDKADCAVSQAESLCNLREAYRTFTPTLHPERLDQPAKRKKPAVIGVCFMGDLFDPAAERFDVFFAIAKAYQHTYVFLTKRPDEMAAYILNMQGCAGALASPNWYLGFSARNQAEFDAGWPHMAKLAAAGWKVWVSLEPMQGPVNLSDTFHTYNIISPDIARASGLYSDLSTVIVGAQSGKNSVTLDTDWALAVQRQCSAAGVPFMFKQDNSTGKVVVLPELDGKRHTATAWGVEA